MIKAYLFFAAALLIGAGVMALRKHIDRKSHPDE